MKEDKNEIKRPKRILIRFTQSGKIASMIMPTGWSVKKLKSFIHYTFKDDIKNNKILIYHSGKVLSNEKLILSSILKEELNQLIITFKPNEDIKDERKSSLEILISNNPDNRREMVMQDNQFEKLELYLYHCYSDILKSNSLNPENELVNKLPLFHSSFDNRVKVANEKNKMTMTDIWDPDNLDNYAFKDYFKIEVFFKLFLFFILFGSHVKGYNLPFFISLLVLYYWYCIYIDLSQFYQKKIDEIKLTEDEMKEFRFLDSDVDDELLEEEEEIVEEHPNIEEQNKDLLNTESIIENQIKNDDIQIENLNVHDIIKEENLQEDSLQKIEKEPQDITQLLKKIEKKKKAKEKQREGTFYYYLTFIFESLQVFVLSLFPMWCDEFEQHHPIIARITNEIAQNQNQNEDNISHDIPPTTQIIENEIEYDSQEREIKIMNDKANQNESEKFMEKSNDTRVVNPSEGQNKYFLVEENENKTENEYVFSENVNIDTLSYNEPIIESLRRKHEREVEDEVEANMQTNK